MRSRWIGSAFALISPLVLISFAACGLDGGVVEEVGSSSGDGGGNDGTIGAGDASPSDGSAGDAGSLDGALPDGSVTSSPLLVYANTQSDLFSFDVASSTLTHVVALDDSCGDNQNDLSMDATGHLGIFESNDAIYSLGLDGICSNRNVLSANASDDLKIANRFAGAPLVIAVDNGQKDYFSIDPVSTPKANVATVTSNLFSDDPQFDVTCSKGGTCWTALSHGNCGSGSSSSCLFSFMADGSGTPVLLGSIGVHPAGLAYANGSLYSFGDDGSIAKIPLGITPLATLVVVNRAAGTTQPGSWNGAASSSANP